MSKSRINRAKHLDSLSKNLSVDMIWPENKQEAKWFLRIGDESLTMRIIPLWL